MIAIPSSYSKTLEKELIANKFSVVIYANHMLRSAYKAMKKTALTILKKRDLTSQRPTYPLLKKL